MQGLQVHGTAWPLQGPQRGRATLHLVSPQSPVMWHRAGTFAGPHLHSSDGDGGAGALGEGGHGLGGAAGRADVVHRHIHLGKTDGQRVRAGQPGGSRTPSLPLPKTAAVGEPAPTPPRAQRCHQRSHIRDTRQETRSLPARTSCRRGFLAQAPVLLGVPSQRAPSAGEPRQPSPACRQPRCILVYG